MNKRNTAIAAGMITYNSGKPCRSGHTSDRYASNGMCIACLGMQASARKDVVKRSQMLRNNALFDGLHPHNVHVRTHERHIIEMLGEILHYSSQSVKDNVESFLKLMYENCPNPRALTRDDLLKLVEFDGWAITNFETLDLNEPDDDEPILYVTFNTHRYVATEVMEVLRNQRAAALPAKTQRPKVVLKLKGQ